MNYKIFENPNIGNNPILFAAWPGIGDVGINAVNFLIKQLNAQPFAELKSQEYFYPHSTFIENNVIKGVYFPKNIFYSKQYKNKTFIFFIGEQQLPMNVELPAEQNPAYKMANDILDLVEKFGCKRIYTSGATFSLIHHSMNTNITYGTDNHFFSAELGSILGFNRLPQTIFEGNFIGGMNGILPLAAIDRNLEAGVLLGNVPIYLQNIQIPYPKATKTVVEAFTKIYKLDIDTKALDEEIENFSKKIEEIMGKFTSAMPTEIRRSIFSGINKLKKRNSKTTKTKNNLTINDVKQAINDIEEFFKKENNDEIQ